jgi:hypothetical protein
MIAGCSHTPSVAPQTSIVVVDGIGQKYRFVSPEVTNKNGTVTSELWEKIEPLDTNHWFARTLSSRLNTNGTPMFNSLSR